MSKPRLERSDLLKVAEQCQKPDPAVSRSEPDPGRPELSAVFQNRSRAHTGRGKLGQKDEAAGVSGSGQAFGEALAGAAELSACGDPCLHLPGSSGGSQRELVIQTH